MTSPIFCGEHNDTVMPYAGHRVVAVTPAGRRRYLELLIPQVLVLHRSGLVDEYELWENSNNAEDRAYLRAQQDLHPDVVRVRHLPPGVGVDGNMSICHFFRECVSDNTVYVRFDDDIVVLDDCDAFQLFLEFRIKNPQFLLVYANILNNAVMSHIQQRHGTLSLDVGVAGYSCVDRLGWSEPRFAAHLHDQVLAEYGASGSLVKYRFCKQWLAYYYERISINCVAWLGDGLRRACGGIIQPDEEEDLACNIPRRASMFNTVYGGYVVVHFAFFTQRPALEAHCYLQRYKQALRKHRRLTGLCDDETGPDPQGAQGSEAKQVP